MSQTRRLAAILAADVAGYSRLMGEGEEGTHERLKSHLRELVEPKIAEHRGRTVKNTGDGLLAEFPSVVDELIAKRLDLLMQAVPHIARIILLYDVASLDQRDAVPLDCLERDAEA
jgi:class 3 adenylate cyclase